MMAEEWIKFLITIDADRNFDKIQSTLAKEFQAERTNMPHRIVGKKAIITVNVAPKDADYVRQVLNRLNLEYGEEKGPDLLGESIRFRNEVRKEAEVIKELKLPKDNTMYLSIEKRGLWAISWIESKVGCNKLFNDWDY